MRRRATKGHEGVPPGPGTNTGVRSTKALQ
jgi:hypothetical protein